MSQQAFAILVDSGINFNKALNKVREDLAKMYLKDEEINIKQKKAEFYDWRWAEPLELPKLIVPFKKKLYQEVIEEFKKYL